MAVLGKQINLARRTVRLIGLMVAGITLMRTPVSLRLALGVLIRGEAGVMIHLVYAGTQIRRVLVMPFRKHLVIGETIAMGGEVVNHLVLV